MMKKLTKCNLDSMQLEMELLHESEQRRVLGGTGSCQHGNNSDTMCPECGGSSMASFEDYLYLEEKGLWAGGWYKGPDGKPSYAPPSSNSGGGPVITGYCQQHGEYRGDGCIFVHSGQGDKYCTDHFYWYSDSSPCTECITGYCGDHEQRWKGEGACTECITGYCGDHDQTWKGEGACTECESAAESITGYCGDHDQKWIEGSGNCTVCDLTNPGGESGSGSGSGSSGTGGSGNTTKSIDYVLAHYTDITFSPQDKNELAQAMNYVVENDVGAFFYDKVFQNDSGVHFRIGETSTYTDPVTGEKIPAIANYDISENTITFNPESDIRNTTLQEELVHVVQSRTYTQMNNRDLNYEFEAKLIGCIYTGLPLDCIQSDTEQLDKFSTFTDLFMEGKCDEITLMENYYYFLDQWEQAGYTDQPGRYISEDFDPKVLRELCKYF